MDFEFSIPIKLTDLQSRQALNDYVVAEVFPSRLLPNKLADLKTALRNFQRNTVITHFDSLYSILCDKTCRTNGLHEAAWVCVIKCMESMHFLLRNALEGNDMRDAQLRNSLTMCLYLGAEFVELMETEANKPTTDQIVAGKKKGRSKSKAQDSLSMDWERERSRAVKCMTKLMNLPIQRLWDPPMVEQALVNCVGNCCFKLLQNPAISKHKDSKDECFQLLASLIKRHKYSLTAAIQAMENLKLFEHMAPLMAEGMAVVAREFSFPKTAQDLLREISSLSAEYLQRDSAASRSCSTFLTELAEMVPDVILPVVSVLLPFLESDPHTMRNAMLVVLGKLIMNLLTSDDLSENKKNLREEFLDTLCEHVHDVNGFVRCKALQVLLNLVEARTLPISHHVTVTALAQGRLMDKLANVRKNAMQLLIVLISHNPYGATLSDKDLDSDLERERAKLAELRETPGSKTLPESAVISPGENWEAMLPETKKAVEDYITDNPDWEDAANEESSLDESLNADSVVEKLIALLTECKPSNAVVLLVKAQGLGSDAISLRPLDDDSSNDQVERILGTLKSIFLSQKTPEVSDMDEDRPVCSQLKEKISEQEIVVKYLEETLKFCRLLQDTTPLICKLLCSKTPSDVVESIQVVISITQFGVTDAIHGLAAMLKLVWVQENSIKNAVVQAFRQLYLYSDDTGESREPSRVVASLIALSKTFGRLFGQQTAWEELVAEFVRSDDISSEVLQLLWHTFTMKISNTSQADSKIALKLIAMASRAKSAVVSSNLDILLQEIKGERARGDLQIAQDVCVALLSVKKSIPRLDKDHAFVSGFVKLLVESVTEMEQATWVPLMEQAVKFMYILTEAPDITCRDLIKQVYSKVVDLEGPPNYTHLMRFVALVGQVALGQLVYLEGDVLQDLKQKRQNKNKDQSGNNTTGGDELGQTGDDMETEVVLKVIERELLAEGNLLSALLPLLVHILTNRSKFDDTGLQAATTLSLGKYMLLSPAVCRDNLRLYFTVLEKSESTEVKINAIVALSDMVFRYPNELEPWTPNLYARLRDDSPTVRKGTLMIMTRLILNDMVKVKGQISEIAVCLVDTGDSTKEMAAQFFAELATKGNALYNVILDIVSRLSDPEVGVDEEKFQVVCCELFRHIAADKQCESLMERFLLRFRATTDERQWRDISFCLSRLSYTEKSLKKMLDRFSCFADKLADDVIYTNFMTIMEKSTQRLKLKPGAKEIITELTAKIDVAHNRGVEDAEAMETATENLPKKPSTKGQNRKKRRTRRGNASSDEDDYASDTSTCSRMSTTSSVSVTQRTGARRSTRKVAPMNPLENLLHQLEEESDEDQENFTPAPKTKVGKKLALSSSDEEISAEAVLTPAAFRGRSTRSRRK